MQGLIIVITLVHRPIDTPGQVVLWPEYCHQMTNVAPHCDHRATELIQNFFFIHCSLLIDNYFTIKGSLRVYNHHYWYQKSLKAHLQNESTETESKGKVVFNSFYWHQYWTQYQVEGQFFVQLSLYGNTFVL